MPAFYAHRYFGECVVAYLPPSVQENIALHKEAFALGTQGPDILFYHKPFSANATKSKGMEMHLASAKDFFLSCHKRLSEEGTDGAFAAYLAGFICHFLLDNACHPNIYVLEAQGVSHGRIESEFCKYLKRKNNLKVHKNAAKDLRAVCKNRNVSQKCDNGVQKSVTNREKRNVARASALALGVQESEIQRAIKTMRVVNGFFSSPSKLFHKFAHFFLKKVGAEEKFGGMFLFFDDDAACDKLNPVLEECLRSAVEETAKTVENFFAPDTLDEYFNIFDKDYKGESLL